MESSFCEKCDNLTSIHYTETNIINKCNSCGNETNVKPSETLMYDESKETIENVFYQRYMTLDPTVQKVVIQKKCHKCNSHLRSRLIVGDDMTPIYKCRCQYNSKGQL